MKKPRDILAQLQSSIKEGVAEVSKGLCCLWREQEDEDEEQERILNRQREKEAGRGMLHRTTFSEQKRWEDLQDIYCIERKALGCGGFGTVRLATLKGSKSIVRALKEVRKTSLHSEKLTQREIGILRHLDHPNICRLYESYEDVSSIYLVLEFIEGCDLFKELQKDRAKRMGGKGERRFNEFVAAHIMRQVFSALAYCHGHKIIHRDLKPENIMVCQQPEGADLCTAVIKIIDWGLAVLFQTDGFYSQSTEGTAPYLAPEAWFGDFSPVSDTWSAGIVLHIILLDRLPYASNECGMLSGAKSISRGARALLRGLLEHNPAKRLTAASALEHPWTVRSTTDKCLQGGTELLKQATSSMTSFYLSEKLRQTALTALATQISGQHLDKARAQFKAMDIDGNGVISKEEVLQAFRNTLSEGAAEIEWSTFDSVFDGVDTDGSGAIEFTEWEAAALRNADGISDEAMQAAFRVLDSDGSGRISVENIARVVARGPSEIAGWLLQFDLNGDGEIDLDEFTAMCSEKTSASAEGNSNPRSCNP